MNVATLVRKSHLHVMSVSHLERGKLMRRVLSSRLALWVGCFFLLAVSAFAQKITGDISGTVTDPTGAAVPNAVVNVQNLGNGEKATATTNEAGFYRIVNLPPGQYRMTIDVQGFKTMERQATVSLALVTEANFTLQVGTRGETVEVQGVAP